MSVTRRLTLWGAPIAALFLTLPVLAEEPRDLLKRMVDAAREQSYYGAFVYERTGSFSTHQVWRQRQGDQTSERLLQADGEPQEWLTRNGNLVCTSSAGLRSAWKASSQLSEQLELLHNWYTLQMLGSTRVANRPVFVLAVKPRDPFRYAYELYLDQETGLLLKSLLINERDVLLERFQFASLNVGELPDQALEPSSICLPVPVSTDERADAGESWLPGWLPPGFVLGHREVRSLDDSEGQVITQVFTDGLARLTVFVEPLGAETLADDLRAQLGPTVAISRRLARAEGDYLATVVGEVPATAAERVADSFTAEAESVQP
ncbi:MAG: MucB/RseB C-terminal domain-containing protein [Pseudomonas sp.]|jgi:sigma-E factor negative regulatory protein RseB|uniref:MucB/RseB C-terminal domain-containing protein n=1 Tax=Halopseudomonas TaxID=2901189 RepID=UPI001B7464DB|nr:MucB/RseB C-terminal domain-containing protein [Pseudomonas sp.]MBQ0779140.1 MucB/RseB C-terminal domain-containing protein [Pseudomonas sp.]WOD10504.1 MucB/RseB C-terminal domain-containing protein [Pseudomonas sp. NyZ704]|tara:strand:+ start:23 stop:982 length:960 start_codon:yes stop_codon:yes gene_type:complete